MVRDAVVIGAGLPGLLAAWRLAQGGMDAVVLERRTAASESSALAAGHVPQESTSPVNLAVLRRTRAIVDELDRATGGVVRFHEVGGLQLAAGADGAEVFRVRAEQAAGLGAAGEFLTPQEAAARWPNLACGDLAGVYYTAGDGFVRSLNLAAVLAEAARQAGAEIWEGCPAERITFGGGRVTGVETGGGAVSPAARRLHLASSNERCRMPWLPKTQFTAFRSIFGLMTPPRKYDRMVMKIEAPTLLMHGTADSVVPFKAAEAVARLRPDWTFTPITGAGHISMLETPRLFLEVAAEFLGPEGGGLR